MQLKLSASQLALPNPVGFSGRGDAGEYSYHGPTYQARRAYGSASSEVSRLSAEARIAEFGRMNTGWDGYDAINVSRKVIYNARVAFEQIFPACPIQEITPNPNGTISFEWESSYGFAALELGATKFSFFLKPCSGGTLFFDGLTDDMAAAAGRLGTLVREILFQFDVDPGFRPTASIVAWQNVRYPL